MQLVIAYSVVRVITFHSNSRTWEKYKTRKRDFLISKPFRLYLGFLKIFYSNFIFIAINNKVI
jgi:hypothetical protein